MQEREKGERLIESLMLLPENPPACGTEPIERWLGRSPSLVHQSQSSIDIHHHLAEPPMTRAIRRERERERDKAAGRWLKTDGGWEGRGAHPNPSPKNQKKGISPIRFHMPSSWLMGNVVVCHQGKMRASRSRNSRLVELEGGVHPAALPGLLRKPRRLHHGR